MISTSGHPVRTTLTPGYHGPLDVSRLPITAKLDTGAGSPGFLAVVIVLANTGSLGMALLFAWPMVETLFLSAFMTLAALLLSLIGAYHFELEITPGRVRWSFRKMAFFPAVEWNEPLAAYTHVVVREARPLLWRFLLHPDDFTRLATPKWDGPHAGAVLAEILLWHGERHDSRSVALGCFLFQDRDTWLAFLRLAARTLDRPIGAEKNGVIEILPISL